MKNVVGGLARRACLPAFRLERKMLARGVLCSGLLPRIDHACCNCQNFAALEGSSALVTSLHSIEVFDAFDDLRSL